MTKGELIRLMEGTDDDIPVVIEMMGLEILINSVDYKMINGAAYYAIKGEFQ